MYFVIRGTRGVCGLFTDINNDRCVPDFDKVDKLVISKNSNTSNMTCAISIHLYN